MTQRLLKSQHSEIVEGGKLSGIYSGFMKTINRSATIHSSRPTNSSQGALI
jgi:hypothetical protein